MIRKYPAYTFMHDKIKLILLMERLQKEQTTISLAFGECVPPSAGPAALHLHTTLMTHLFTDSCKCGGAYVCVKRTVTVCEHV